MVVIEEELTQEFIMKRIGEQYDYLMLLEVRLVRGLEKERYEELKASARGVLKRFEVWLELLPLQKPGREVYPQCMNTGKCKAICYVCYSN